MGDNMIPKVSNAEAQDWVDRVYLNLGSVSQDTANLVNEFCIKINSAGLRKKFIRLNLFCGNDINSCVTPLFRGPIPFGPIYGNQNDTNTQNGAYVDFFYLERGYFGGLQGYAGIDNTFARRFLRTGVRLGHVPDITTNAHLSFYSNNIGGKSGTQMGVYESAARGFTLQVQQNFYNTGAFPSITTMSDWTIKRLSEKCFYLSSYDTDFKLNLYAGNSELVDFRQFTSVSPMLMPTAQDVVIFGEGRSTAISNYTGRIQGYSIGYSMTSAEVSTYYSIMQSFQTSLGRNIDVPIVSNIEAQNWIYRVFDNGGFVDQSTANLVNTFCESIQTNDIRKKLHRLNLMCGRNVDSVRVPLYKGVSETILNDTTPTSIGSCSVWLDANDLSTLKQNSNGTTDVTVDGDRIGYWQDKSGSGNHATQSTNTARPRLLSDSKITLDKKLVHFDVEINQNNLTRRGKFLSVTKSNVWPFTLSFAFYNHGNAQEGITSTSPTIFGGRVSGCFRSSIYFGATNTLQLYATGPEQALMSLSVDAMHVISMTVAADRRTINVYHNLRLHSSFTVGNDVNLNELLSLIGSSCISSGYGRAGSFISFGEIVVHDKLLSVTEVTTLHNYLMGKWNAELGNKVETNGTGSHTTNTGLPINGFIETDYLNAGRYGGLKGNNAKFFNTGFFQNHLPLLDRHLSVYVTEFSNTVSYDTLIGVDPTGSPNFSNSWHLTQYWVPNAITYCTSNLNSGVGVNNFTSHGLILGNTPSTSVSLYVGNNQVANTTISSPTTQTITSPLYVFALNRINAATDASSARISAYSTGKSLTANEITNFNNSLNTFYNSLNRSPQVPTVSNVEAQDWVYRVYANGGTVSQSTANAVSSFCDSISSNSLRSKFWRLNLFCGDNLAACLTPLYRSTSLGGTVVDNLVDTPVNFFEYDYTETGSSGGLTGNGTTKYINTSVNTSSFGTASDVHLGAYLSFPTIPAGNALGSFAGDTAGGNQFLQQFRLSFTAASTTYTVESAIHGTNLASLANQSGNNNGLFLVSRTSLTDLTLYRNASSIATNTTSTSPVTAARPMYVFANNNVNSPSSGSFFNGIMRYYSLGLGLTSGQVSTFNTIMTTFQTALNRNV